MIELSTSEVHHVKSSQAEIAEATEADWKMQSLLTLCEIEFCPFTPIQVEAIVELHIFNRQFAYNILTTFVYSIQINLVREVKCPISSL